MKSKNCNYLEVIEAGITVQMVEIPSAKGFYTSTIMFEDIVFGDKDDWVYPSYIYDGMRQILHSEKLIVVDMDSFEIFEMLETNMDNHEKNQNTYEYLLNFSSFTDQVIAFSYVLENKVYINWKTIDNGNLFVYEIDKVKFELFWTKFEKAYKKCF